MKKLGRKGEGAIGCLVLFIVALILASSCGDSETGTDKEPVISSANQQEKPPNRCETARAIQVRESVDTLIARGVLSIEESNTLSFSFFVDPAVWRSLKYEEKKNLLNSLEEYSICRFKSFRVVYLSDAYSGKRLGKTTGGGPKIYTD